MDDEDSQVQRRSLLQTAAGLAVGQMTPGSSQAAAAAAAAAAATSEGKVGDFNFLAGEWKISHRRLKRPGTQDWDIFEGQATCWTVLGGVGSIEELRIPARNFSGMGIRLLDTEKRIWSDFWVNSRSGVLVPPGTTGHFVDGVGTFEADDTDGDTPIKVRGIWDRVTPTSCRWHQAISRDGGKLWEGHWFMDWVRA